MQVDFYSLICESQDRLIDSRTEELILFMERYPDYIQVNLGYALVIVPLGSGSQLSDLLSFCEALIIVPMV